MAFDTHLADRLRTAILRARPDEPVDERKMFGGLALMLGGSMACGVIGDQLMVRVGHDATAAALQRPHARPMDFTGKPLRGFVYVAGPGFSSDADLDAWVALGLAGARNHPKKPSASTKSPKPSARANARQPRAR